MYPFIRMAKEIWKYRNAPALGPGVVKKSS